MIDVLLNLWRKDREFTAFEYDGSNWLLSSVPLMYKNNDIHETQLFRLKDADKFVGNMDAEAIDWSGVWYEQHNSNVDIHEAHKDILSRMEHIIDDCKEKHPEQFDYALADKEV